MLLYLKTKEPNLSLALVGNVAFSYGPLFVIGVLVYDQTIPIGQNVDTQKLFPLSIL